MRIETLEPDGPAHVTVAGENIELALGEEASRTGSRRVVTMSLPQAEMLMHALGLVIAQIHERQRCQAEERAHLAQVVFDTEFRLHEH